MYMVRKIKIVDIYANEEADANDDQVQEQSSDQANTHEPDVVLFEATPDTEVAANVESADAAADATAVEEPSPKPIHMPKSKSKNMLDMRTTTKALEQVSC